MEPETIQVGEYLLRKELLDRRWLHGFKIKTGTQLLYPTVWAVRESAAGPDGQPVRYFETLKQARAWAEAGGREPGEAES